MDTYTFEWMNGGQPFDFGPHRVTPHAARASAAHKSKVLKDRLRDMDLNGMPPLAVQAVVDSVKDEAYMAAGDALIFWSLVQVDPKVEGLGLDSAMRHLTLDDYGNLMESAKRPDKVGKAVPDPLARTRAMKTSSTA